MTNLPIDSEPGPGSRVVDDLGDTWLNTSEDDPFQPGAANWENERDLARGFHEPETWGKVSGNYGPVRMAP